MRGLPFIAFVIFALAPSFVAAADADGYPPGLFEHSPLIDPNHPPLAPPEGPQSPADALPPVDEGMEGLAPPDAPYSPSDTFGGALMSDPYCLDIAHRLFGSLAELRAAHGRCDR
jgi:hypothetical protein